MVEADTTLAKAESYEDICTFCREASGGTPQNLFYDLGLAMTRSDYVLYESDHHVVFPCIGALTDWYVLIVSRQHTLSAGWLTTTEQQDLRQMIAHVRQRLTDKTGLSVMVFEHGSYDFPDKGGACYDHAHVHVVATDRTTTAPSSSAAVSPPGLAPRTGNGTGSPTRNSTGYGRCSQARSTDVVPALAKSTGRLRGAPWQHATPEVTLTDDARWSAVARLLHDPSIKLDVRVAGLFVLLYGQPLTRICRLTPDQVSRSGDDVTIQFGATPVILPAPLDGLVLGLLHRRGPSSYASRPTHWLFPGGSPGRHRNASTFRRRLAEVGVMLQAALMQLAAEVPAAVLADLLGLAPSTAIKWATIASRDWATYTAQRAHSQRI